MLKWRLRLYVGPMIVSEHFVTSLPSLRFIAFQAATPIGRRLPDGRTVTDFRIERVYV